MADYNAMELMICVAARLLEDGSTAAVGTGAPVAAAVLAQKTHAPNLLIVFEAGGGCAADAVNADFGRGLAQFLSGFDGNQYERHHGDLPAWDGGLYLPEWSANRPLRQP